jgi:hypothetical protein
VPAHTLKGGIAVKKLLYPVVILGVVIAYIKTAQKVIGPGEVKTIAGMLTADLGKLIDAIIGVIEGFGHMVFS